MKFYHATRFENLSSILEKGLQSRCEGVYLCERPEDALKFLRVKGITPIVVFEVNIRKNSKRLYESFDHSYAFFKCRAFVYADNIPLKNITKYTVYKFN